MSGSNPLTTAQMDAFVFANNEEDGTATVAELNTAIENGDLSWILNNLALVLDWIEVEEGGEARRPER